MSDPLKDCLVAAVAILIVGVGMGLLSALMKARQDARLKRRNGERFAGGIPATARMLAAKLGSRLAVGDWTNILHDFHQAGFSLEETLGLIRTFPRLFKIETAFDFRDWLARKNAWSIRTFGPGDSADRAAGILDHIRKELQEIEREPMDVEEWIDVAFLSLDGAFRAGGTPDAVTDALAAKLAKNIGRKWPDWRTAVPGKAIEHDRTADRGER